MRTKRLAHERRLLVFRRKFAAIEVLRKYKISELPCTKPMPESADFCAFPPVVEILEQPSDVDVTEKSFDSIKEDLDTWIEKWRSKVEAGVIGRIGKGRSFSVGVGLKYDQAKKRLKLATTVFTCQSCSWFRGDLNDDPEQVLNSEASASKCRPLFFPHVVGHRCLTLSCTQLDHARDTHRDPSTFMTHWTGWRAPWSADYLIMNERLGMLVEHIVEACGLDAGKVTAEEMDRRDDRLACLRCAEMVDGMRGYRRVPVFGWREAVRILIP
jgi:hypothetical protein